MLTENRTFWFFPCPLMKENVLREKEELILTGVALMNQARIRHPASVFCYFRVFVAVTHPYRKLHKY